MVWKRRAPKIEVFWEPVCEHGGIFRSGPGALQMYADFGFACYGKKNSPKPGQMEIKALVAPRLRRWLHWIFISFSRDHLEACFRLARDMGYEPKFERAKRLKPKKGKI